LTGNHLLDLQRLNGAIERSDYTGFEVITTVWRMLAALPLAELGRKAECVTCLEQARSLPRATTCTTYDAMLAGIEASCHLLGFDGQVILRDGKVSLNASTVWVDAIAFRHAQGSETPDEASILLPGRAALLSRGRANRRGGQPTAASTFGRAPSERTQRMLKTMLQDPGRDP